MLDTLAHRLFWLRALGISLVALLFSIGLWLQLPMAYQQLLIIDLAWAVLHSFILFSQQRWAVTSTSLSLQLAADIFIVSSLLAFSGGVHNPLFSLLLLPILLTAGILPKRALYSLLLLISTSATLLIMVPAPINNPVPVLPNKLYELLFLIDGSLVRHNPFNPLDVLEKIGLGLTITLMATLVTLFVSRLHQQLRQQQHALQQAQLATQSQQHLLSMSLSAAATAHELSTPLASISLLADEAKDAYQHQEITEGEQALKHIQQLVQLCKQQISASLTQHQLNPSEPLARCHWVAYLEQLLTQWKTLYPQMNPSVHIQGRNDPPYAITLPALSQSIHSLLNNAKEATTGVIRITLDWDHHWVTLCIYNEGAGFSRERLAHFPQPQLSQKQHGHGIGLTLAEANIRQLGGRLTLNNPPQGGACVCIYLPSDIQQWQVRQNDASQQGSSQL